MIPNPTSLRLWPGIGVTFFCTSRRTSLAQPFGRLPAGNSFCVQSANTPAAWGVAMSHAVAVGFSGRGEASESGSRRRSAG